MAEALWVKRDDLRTTKRVTWDTPVPADGEILVAVDKFALTANNVTYAVAGDQIGYWRFYPAEGDWGQVPVWGYGDVVVSNCDAIPVGERIYGFFPMASHVILRPGRVKAEQFADVAAHRAELPVVYNNYSRTAVEPDIIRSMEDERSLLFPLFITSYALYDYLVDNDFFGARQVVVGSVSSKTGFGLAHLLHHGVDVDRRIVGLTSPANVAFVESLDACDAVLTYDRATTLDPTVPTAFVDMSGDGPLAETLHRHFGDALVESCQVGVTHWEAPRRGESLPGAEPSFFFAPSQIVKRESEWGAGVFMGKANEAAVALARALAEQMRIEKVEGVAALEAIWLAMVDNRVIPSRGIMVSPAG